MLTCKLPFRCTLLKNNPSGTHSRRTGQKQEEEDDNDIKHITLLVCHRRGKAEKKRTTRLCESGNYIWAVTHFWPTTPTTPKHWTASGKLTDKNVFNNTKYTPVKRLRATGGFLGFCPRCPFRMRGFFSLFGDASCLLTGNISVFLGDLPWDAKMHFFTFLGICFFSSSDSRPCTNI